MVVVPNEAFQDCIDAQDDVSFEVPNSKLLFSILPGASDLSQPTIEHCGNIIEAAVRDIREVRGLNCKIIAKVEL